MNNATGWESQPTQPLTAAIRPIRSRRNMPVIEALESRQMLSASVINPATSNPMVVTLGAGSPFDSVSFDNGAGQFFHITLTGPGTATVPLLGSPLASTAKHKTDVVTGSTFVSVDSITITATTAKSTLKVSGSLNLNSLTTNSAIGSIVAPGVYLQGAAGSLPGETATLVNLTAGGGIGKLVLGPVDYCNISITGAPAAHGMAISVTDFGNSTLSSTVPIRSFTTPLDVAEGISASTFDLTGQASGKATDLGKLVTSNLDGTTITSSGNVGSISAASTSDSDIYAGVTPANGAALPSTLGQFTSRSSIASIKVGSFTNSDVAAFALGNLSLGSVDFLNGGTPFGVAAASIAALSGRNQLHAKFSLKKLTSPAAVTEQLAKQKTSLAGTDLLITII
jgi:hypothetical protein